MFFQTLTQPVNSIRNKTKSFIRRTSGKIPLRIMIIVPFAIQITGAVGIVGFLSFRNGQDAVGNIATQLEQAITKQVETNLETYLRIPQQVNQTNTDLLRAGKLSMQDLPQWREILWQQARLYPSVTTIITANTKGDSFSSFRYEDGSIATARFDASTGFNLYTYKTDDRGKPIGEPSITKNYEPQKRPFYQVAIAAGKPAWSAVYPNLLTQVPQISLSLPIYDANHKLLGVTGTAVSLVNIDKFLDGLNISKNGKAFIMERDKGLIATSTVQKPFMKVQGQVKRLTVADFDDPVLQLTAKYLEQQFPDFQKITQPTSLTFRANNENYFLQISPLGNGEGLDWLTVVILPESDFIGKIQENTQVTALLCFATLLGAVLIGVITSRRIVKPIEDLKDSAVAMAEGDFTTKVDLDHRTDEIGALAKAFNAMSLDLQGLFTNLEGKVTERTIALEQALQELKRTQSAILQTEKMSSLGQMVAGVAHEINNPVSFIRGNINHLGEYVDNLLELVHLYQKNYPQPSADIAELTEEIDLEFITEDLPKTLDSMQNGTERIKKIVLSLRNFSRLDEDGKKPVDIHNGIDSTVLILSHRLQPTTTRPAISVVQNYGELPLVNCDPGQMNQVFLNILNNAVDAIEERYALNPDFIPEIAISTRLVEAELVQGVEIRIADNGIGIPESLREKIFDPFFTTKPVGKGAGLGLTSCYQIIVEKHGGAIEVNPRDNNSTEFVITIPVKATNS